MGDNKTKGTNIPNQNNISAVIKSQILDMTEIVDVIVKAVTKKKLLYTAKTVVAAKLYSTIVKTLFESNGVVQSIYAAADVITPMSNKNVKTKGVKKLINSISDLNIYLIDNLTRLSLLNLQLNSNTDIVSGILNTAKNIELINTELLKIKDNNINVKRIKSVVKDISAVNSILHEFSSKLNNYNEKLTTDKYVDITTVINNINELYKEIIKLQTPSLIEINLRYNYIKRSLNKIIKLFNDIDKLQINKNTISNVNTKLKTIKVTYGDVLTLLNAVTILKAPNKKFNIDSAKLMMDSIYEFNKTIIDFVNTLSAQDNSKKINSNIIIKGITDTLSSITKIYDILLNAPFASTKLKVKCIIIKRDINRILELITDIKNINVNTSIINETKDKLSIIKTVYDELFALFNIISDTKVPKFLGIKLIFATLSIIKLIAFCNVMAALIVFTPIVIAAQITLTQLSITVNIINSIFNTVNGLKLGIKTFIKIKLIPVFLIKLIDILLTINLISEIINKTSAIKDSANIFLAFELIKHIFNTVRSIPTGLFMALRLKKIRRNILLLGRVITAINILKVLPRTVKKLLMLQLVVNMLASVFLTIVIASPIFLLGSVLIWILVGAVLILKTAISIITKSLAKIATDPKLLLGFLAITLITGFITVMSLMLLTIALIAKPVISATLDILKLFGVITAVTIASVLLGILTITASPILLPALAGLAVLSLMIIAIGTIALVLKGLEMLNLDGEKIKENVEIVLSTANMIIDTIFNRNYNTKENGSKQSWLSGIINFVSGSLGTILKSIVSFAFLTVTIGSICMILLIAMQLRLIQMLDLDPNKIRKNVDLVINTALYIISNIFDKKDTKSENSNKTWIPDVIKNFGNGLSNIINGIMSIGFLATALVSIQLVLIIAAQLRLLQILDLDDAKIRQNIDTVIGTVLYVISSLFDRDDTNSNSTNKSWIADVINFVGGPIVKIAQAIMAISFLATSIASIALIKVLAGQLKTISDINLPDNISDKVQSIIIAANQVTEALYSRKDTATGETNEKKKGFLKSILSGLGSAVDMIASLPWLSTAMVSVGMVSKLAEQLTTINNIPDVSNITSKTEAICNAADNLIKHLTTRPETGGDIENNSRLDIIDKINMSIQSVGDIKPKQLKTINSVFDDYSKFIDKVNTVDVTKLETSANMFAQMAKFSNSIQGDFKQLAETLNEHLMPVLEELKEIMGEIPEKLDTGFQNTSASIAATTVTPTAETVTAQVNRENPTMDKKQVDTIVQNRLKEYSKNEATGVVAKLDQLIDLLKGYSGENVMVKTV